MSVYEYWIGLDVNVKQIWRDYEAGLELGYDQKFYERTCHLLEIEFDVPVEYPIFASEAIFKTTKRYFHDLKRACLTPRDYDLAAPLYFYGVERGSAIWQWLGELRQLILFGTTLGDEKVVGQTLDNIDKKLSILSKYFGSSVNRKDFDAFMIAKTAPDIEAAVRKMLKQQIKRVSISKEPVRDGAQPTSPASRSCGREEARRTEIAAPRLSRSSPPVLSEPTGYKWPSWKTCRSTPLASRYPVSGQTERALGPGIRRSES